MKLALWFLLRKKQMLSLNFRKPLPQIILRNGQLIPAYYSAHTQTSSARRSTKIFVRLLFVRDVTTAFLVDGMGVEEKQTGRLLSPYLTQCDFFLYSWAKKECVHQIQNNRQTGTINSRYFRQGSSWLLQELYWFRVFREPVSHSVTHYAHL